MVTAIPQSDTSITTSEDDIEETKFQIIDRVVIAVTNWLWLTFAAAHQTSGHSEATQSDAGQLAQSGQHKSSSEYSLTRKRKLVDRGNDDGGEDDGDDMRDSRRADKIDKGKRRELPKFACPYFKYNPAKYKEWRGCLGPGWPDVHRVKDHLYRRHRQPSHRCGRCWQPFENEEDYLSHQRTTEPCALRDKEPIEGFDASQERKLKSRKRATNDPNEVAKWQAVFSILFPHVAKEDIPSPFYDYDSPSSETQNLPDSLTECEEYILRELPPRLRQSLRPEFDREFHIIEESLKLKAIDHVKMLLKEAFHEFRQVQQRRTTSDVTFGASRLEEEAGSSSTQALPMSALQDNQPSFPGQASFLDYDFSLGFIDPSALANLEASLSEGAWMEEIIPQPADFVERKQSDSGYESNILEHSSHELSEEPE
ncbi:hypothetical protein M434DRAFT_282610 [Hypoxylon sp. CO27-5]|nr:hypothetical protein M434DRAFT_282610 [Hypoxylon sp. CO27-5]